MEKYSVLMSVYIKENPEFLEKSIDSMINQTVKPDEIVIVKDGPLTSDLDLVIKFYNEKYPNIFKILALEKNGGLGNALNEGLKICKNNLVARMDSDDISFQNRCELQLKRFEKKEDLAILGGQIIEFSKTVTNTGKMRVVPCSNDEITKFSHKRSPFNHPTVMYKKDIIMTFGGYPTVKRKEDLGLFVRLANSNLLCENLNECLLYYRTNNDNLKRRKSFVNCKEYIDIMHRFYKEGIINIFDMSYIVLGQLSLYCFPSTIVKLLSEKILRKSKH